MAMSTNHNRWREQHNAVVRNTQPTLRLIETDETDVQWDIRSRAGVFEIVRNDGSIRFQVSSAARLTLQRNDTDDGDEAELSFIKSGNATPGSFTIVANNEDLGQIVWYGDDGVDYNAIAASILVEVDGTPGVGDMPGRMIFGTTPDGSETTTEVFRITAAQDLRVNNGGGLIVGSTSAQLTGNSAAEFQVLGTAAADSSAILAQFSAAATGPDLAFVKSRNATIGSFTIAQDNDVVGTISWLPDDGVDHSTLAAEFSAEVDDASPAAGDIGMAFVWRAMPGGAGAIEEHARLDAAGSFILNQQAQDLVHLVLRSSDVTTGATTIVKGGTVTTNDYLTIAKDVAATGGAHIQAIAESTVAVGMTISAWAGAPATTDTSGSLGTMNFAVGQHNGSNADADMAADSNAFTWAEIDASNAYLTRMLLKADDGELHLGNTTLVALDAEDDVMLVRAMQKTSSDGRGIVESVYDPASPFHYDRLRELKLVGEKDASGFYLFPLQPRLALHEGALWQLFTDLMDVVKALPENVRQALSPKLQQRLLLAGN